MTHFTSQKSGSYRCLISLFWRAGRNRFKVGRTTFCGIFCALHAVSVLAALQKRLVRRTWKCDDTFHLCRSTEFFFCTDVVTEKQTRLTNYANRQNSKKQETTTEQKRHTRNINCMTDLVTYRFKLQTRKLRYWAFGSQPDSRHAQHGPGPQH